MDWVLFIGRFQPFHAGHAAIISNLLEEGNNVCVGIRNTTLGKTNPYSVVERRRMVYSEFGDEVKAGRVTFVTLPDITYVAYGRTPGWQFKEVVLSKELQEISATKIRERGGK